jgi:hypothetical protein
MLLILKNTFKLIILISLVLSTHSIARSKKSLLCAPCKLKQGVCKNGKAELVCLVDSVKRCPEKGDSILALIPKPKDAACMCEDKDGLTKVRCIMP